MSAFARRALVVLFYASKMLLLATVSIWLSLYVAPMQNVTDPQTGQVFEVGASAPNLTTPGELVFAGLAIAPMQHRFTGPIAPQLVMQPVQLDRVPASSRDAVLTSKDKIANRLGHEMVRGWIMYFLVQTLIAIGIGIGIRFLLLAWRAVSVWQHQGLDFAAVCGVIAQRWRAFGLRVLRVSLAGFAVVLLANGTAIAGTGYQAAQVYGQATSPNDLFGTNLMLNLPSPVGPKLPAVRVVVMGDSTGSGYGLAWPENPTTLDKACGRSRLSIGSDLAQANGWNVLTVACGGATLDSMNQPQHVSFGSQDLLAPPQLSVAEQAVHAKFIIVQGGEANPWWANLLYACFAVSGNCGDKASTAVFQQYLNNFQVQYRAFLGQLQKLSDDLPGHPQIIINEYYKLFGSDVSSMVGVMGNTLKDAQAKAAVINQRVDQLNEVIATLAESKPYGFTVVDPSFAGREVGYPGSDVQRPPNPHLHIASDSAPFHPSAAGASAIALADQLAIDRLRYTVQVGPRLVTNANSTLSAGR